MAKKIALEQLGTKIDKGFKETRKRFDVHDRRFDLIDKKLNDQDKRSDNFGQAVLNLLDDTRDIKENMVIKKDIDKVNTTLDKQTVILKKLDQGRIFTIERIKRLEAEVSSD